MPDYLTVTCRLPAATEEALAGALERWPVLGCQVEDAGGALDVTVYLRAERAAAVPGVRQGLAALGARDVASAHFAEQDWLADYRRHAMPRAIGTRFWLDPSPTRATPPPDGRIPLLIEPRQAFGSGSHESTQLVLLALEEVPVAGRSVLDIGTGSGVLALAARALGASWALGFDRDAQAVWIARQTVAVQPRRVPVALFAGTAAALGLRASFDLVLANLLPAEAQPLLGNVHALLAMDGLLVLSGLMADQCAASESELARAGFRVRRSRELNEWVALMCTKR
jgi:ribosomal protein L11 methyltransferase